MRSSSLRANLSIDRLASTGGYVAATRVFDLAASYVFYLVVARALSTGATVSPVASMATFSDDEIITHSFAAKCLLRTVAERITRTVPRVWYFPSFEMTLAYNPATQMADNRHVKNWRIDRIFRMLNDTLVR
jgi:GSCFA family